MSKIPSVKSWRVTYWRDAEPSTRFGNHYAKRIKLATCTVDTINKRFARWIAPEQIGYPASYSMVYPNDFIRVTVSLVKKGKE